MALEVRDALVTGTHRVIEAGTGVGKSMAYLVPFAEAARRNNITVGIATKSNNLADQLMYHELPKLAEQLDGGLSFCALKGYDHYPCLRKLERMSRGQVEITTKRDPADTLTVRLPISRWRPRLARHSVAQRQPPRLYDGLARVCSSPLPVFP